MSARQRIQQLLDPYDESPTECDGMVRLGSTILYQYDIEHQPMVGTLSKGERTISPHFWLDLPSGERIDYRARMWLGNNESVPHGFFNPDNYPQIKYIGNPTKLDPLPPWLFKVLTDTSIKKYRQHLRNTMNKNESDFIKLEPLPPLLFEILINREFCSPLAPETLTKLK